MQAGNMCAALVAGALALGVAATKADGISDGTVKIGVLTDMAGVFSDLAGAGAVTAAQMAIDDFVAGESLRGAKRPKQSSFRAALWIASLRSQ
jgi:branched-chain amino acid transport system substrate-binding protein